VSATIRDYLPGDLASVTELVHATLSEYGFAPKVGGLAEDLAAIRDRYQTEHGGFWVAEEAGRVLGTVAVRKKEGRTCELKRLYVRAGARGRGLGQRLYDRAEEFARGAGYERIWLDSSRRFKEARRLYERNGFVLVEELSNDWEDNVYEKRL
jgi:putative acetyltransferase